MRKKVEMGMKPKPAQNAPEALDEWVSAGQGKSPAGRSDAPPEPMKRLTIDVPDGLHRRIKTSCASRGTKMADEIRGLLETHFPEA